jgi:hypothetical protein
MGKPYSTGSRGCFPELRSRWAKALGGSSPSARIEQAACDSGYSRELALNLAIHRALKAHKQLLVENLGNALKGR